MKEWSVDFSFSLAPVCKSEFRFNTYSATQVIVKAVNLLSHFLYFNVVIWCYCIFLLLNEKKCRKKKLYGSQVSNKVRFQYLYQKSGSVLALIYKKSCCVQGTLHQFDT